MSRKKTTTIYIREDLLNAAKKRKINISKLVNDVLQSLLSDEETMRLNEIEKKIEKLMTELAKLKALRNALEEQIKERERQNRSEQHIKKLIKQHIELKERASKTNSAKELNSINARLEAISKELNSILFNDLFTEDRMKFWKALNKKNEKEAWEIARRRLRA